MGFKPIDWNTFQDEKDFEIWDRMTANFWLPEKIPLSNDITSWNTLSEKEKDITMKVFAGLTTLDTLQASVGAISLLEDAVTQHEEANYTFIAAMESIHAKSYSNIFMTLANTKDINNVMSWAESDGNMQNKVNIISSYYKGDNPYKKKVASVLLESFLFYSGFYWPFYLSSRSKLTNTADIIKLIVRDESIHGYYIGYKYQYNLNNDQNLTLAQKEELKDFTINLLQDLYDNEIKYTESIYNGTDVIEDVKRFLKYNANKALNNLGYEGIFDKNETNVSPEIMVSVSTTTEENHDFFSGSGSSYVIGKVEEITDDDWDF